MDKITFINGQEPAINGSNLNKIQDNVENAIIEMIDLLYPIGSYYHTSDITFDPNITWGGSWELEEDGTVLVSKSSEDESKFNVAVGTILGEEEHQLTVNEMPSHKHGVGYAQNKANGIYAGMPGTSVKPENFTNSLFINNEGGDLPHNNVQPSKVVNRWHRTA